MQVIVSLGQIYGDVLYYSTNMFDEYYNGLVYCRPEGYYYWFYYFFMNIIWIIVPACTLLKLNSHYVIQDHLLMVDIDHLFTSVNAISRAMKSVGEGTKIRKTK